MNDDIDKLRQDLRRYRALLRATTDPAAIAALTEMIAEIETAHPSLAAPARQKKPKTEG